MDKLIGLLHLCRKAGKLKIGQKAVLSLHTEGHQPLILMAVDAGSGLKRKLAGCGTLTVGWSSEKMGVILGREKVSVLGITDGGFAAEIKNVMKSERLLVI